MSELSSPLPSEYGSSSDSYPPMTVSSSDDNDYYQTAQSRHHNNYGNNVEDLSKIPPQDVGAERSVLGGMLISKDATRDAMAILEGIDFYWPRHELIYNALTSLENNNEPVDAITATEELVKRGDLDKIGGSAYLHELSQYVPTAANVNYYSQIVKDKSTLRAVVNAGNKITSLGFNQEGDIVDIVDIAQQEVFDLTTTGRENDYVALGDAISDVATEIERISQNKGELTGLSTGLVDVDRFTQGLQPGQLVVVAARPGVGKSTLGLDFARAAAIKSDVPTAFFSLEMGRNEIVMKILAAQGRINYGKLRAGSLSDRDWTTLSGLEGQLQNVPLIIDDSPNLTLAEIRSKARRLKEQNGLGLIIVDYLQLMSSGSNKKVENRQQEVGEFSRSLKLLAKELELPIVALSQLNRGSEQRGDKRPALSDMRESGAIEQDADIVFLIHREFMNDPEHPDAHKAEIIVAKNRGGPTGNVDVIFQGQYSRIENATDQMPPDLPNTNLSEPSDQVNSGSVATQSW